MFATDRKNNDGANKFKTAILSLLVCSIVLEAHDAKIVYLWIALPIIHSLLMTI